MTDFSKQVEVSELFMSLEGEGPYTSRPTVYVRFARCNFTCSGFNNPTNERDARGYAPIAFDPKSYTQLKDIPLITCGCDSQYAVNPAFAHIWKKMSIDDLANGLVELLPHKQWRHPMTGLPVSLSLTGGEPTLHWKRILDLLKHPALQECAHIIYETNAAVPLSDAFIEGINEWCAQDESRTWTWSNSPKLSASGEPFDEAIRPDIIAKQQHVMGCDQYFKFVCGPVPAQFEEVRHAMDTIGGYSHYEIQGTQIWVMPAACTTEQQNADAQAVANMCMEHGYIFCYRLQNALWGNGVGC